MSFYPTGIFAATSDSTTSSSSGLSFSGLTIHPGEDASAKEEDDWWRLTESVISQTDAAFYIVVKEPPRLSHLEAKDLTGFSEVAVPASTEVSNLKVLDYNRKVKAAVAENAQRAKAREASRGCSLRLLSRLRSTPQHICGWISRSVHM